VTTDRAGFRAVLALRDARILVFSSLVGRLPIVMSPLAVLLAVREATGSFGPAGLAAGALAAANGVSAPVLGRMVDRIGQRRVLLGASLGQAAALLTLALLTALSASAVWLVVLAAVAGMLVPPTAACVRALWPEVARTPLQRESAYALEATTQEFAWVAAPILVAGGIAVSSAVAVLVLAATLSLVGNGVFASTRLSQDRRGQPPVAGGSGLLSDRRLRVILASAGLIGLAFGALQVGMSALAEVLGAPDTGAVMVAASGVGSLTGGILYGSRAWRGSLDGRYVVFLALSGLAAAPLLLASSLPVAIVLSGLAGVAYAPALSCHYALVEGLTPAHAITEAFTWSNAFLISGTAIGIAVGGWLVEIAVADAAMALVCASLLLAAAAAAVRPAPRRPIPAVGS
jgi:MFS family permease